MTSNLNTSKRGEPEKSNKSKPLSIDAMTLNVKDPPLIRVTMNEKVLRFTHIVMLVYGHMFYTCIPYYILINNILN